MRLPKAKLRSLLGRRHSTATNTIYPLTRWKTHELSQREPFTTEILAALA
ncbi:hypothetical protein NRI_0232 [Neorickettsia risticii str. Illinois]|uniref:Uncharacterized protein n=1 Tax=Neorickettsia risticii (strain Illinois) TaxID=434131 RepID=C6V4A7_NEORI|nr:hypothetical protein NRI_0232 [Neorickettsia risticii str. Illinois]